MIGDTECSVCAKLDLFCESYELSAVSPLCLRCNHQEKAHSLAAGQSNRPFPLFLFPVANTKEDISLPKLQLSSKKGIASQTDELAKENEILRIELSRLQADLRSAQTLITEITTGNLHIQTSNLYNSRCRDVALSHTRVEIDECLYPIKKVAKEANNAATPIFQCITLKERLIRAKKLQIQLKEEEDMTNDVSKTLMRHISRHTLITRKFINSHFQKLESSDSPLSCTILFSHMIEKQLEYLKKLHWIQKDCFEAFKMAMKEKGVKLGYYCALFECLVPVIEKENHVLHILKSLPFEKHETIRVWIEFASELPAVVEQSQRQAVFYASSFASIQVLLEKLFEEYPESASFFQQREKEAHIGFSDTLLSPLRHASNYTTLFSELLDMLHVTDKWFKQYVSMLSTSRQIEKELCTISSHLRQSSSSIRSQKDLFSHKSGLIYNNIRELRRQIQVMVFHPECSDLPFFQRFLRATLYVFSDSIIFDYRDFSNSKSLHHIDLAHLVTVGEPKEFSTIPLVPKVAPLLKSSFVIVTLQENVLVVAETPENAFDLINEISEEFYHLSCSRVRGNKAKETNLNVTYQALAGTYWE